MRKKLDNAYCEGFIRAWNTQADNIIRCRDCDHFNDEETYGDCDGYCDEHCGGAMSDDFCSWAVRVTDE